MAQGTRKVGEFCWFNMLTPDPGSARTFFAAALGWTFMEIPQGHIVLVDGHMVGGLFDLNSPHTPPGLPPAIGVMVKVDNADAVAQRAQGLGGRSKPGLDIGDQGRTAECFDPAGAEFDLWQPGRNAGTDVDTNTHGAPSWFELLTTDTASAERFYTSLFGWTANAVPMGPSVYTTFSLDGAFVGGMMAVTPEMGAVPPHWATYFTVDDVDRAVEQATAAGGAVVLAPHDIAGVGRIAGLRSPQGVIFWVITYSR